MRVAVLCYHSQNIQGHSYELNDHVAFAHDLHTLVERSIPIISVEQLVRHLKGVERLDLQAAVVLTCDDGTTLDWFDYQHPEFGFQASFNSILRDTLGAQRCESASSALMTSFVIACPVARGHIDQGCYGGEPLSDDSWWKEAGSSGYWSIENHSWNHWHVSLPFQVPAQQALGQFYTINNYLRATKQIRQATDLINSKLGPIDQNVRYFAYPYGHAADYLQYCYLPNYTAQHAIEAAFTTQAGFVSEQSPLYALPRFVCGEAWKSPEQFAVLLDQLVR